MSDDNKIFSFGGDPILYPPISGVQHLKKLISKYLGRYIIDEEPNPEDILITNGATQGLFATFSALNIAYRTLYYNRRIIYGLLTPCWRTIPENQIRLLNGVVKEIPMPFSIDPSKSGCIGTWKIDLDQIRDLVEKNYLDAILLDNPVNPTSHIIDKGELESLLSLASDHELYVIMDITYEAMILSKMPSVPKHLDLRKVYDKYKDNIFLIGSFSKMFGIPGARIGYMIPPEHFRELTQNIIQLSTLGVNVLAQKLMISALTDWLETDGQWFETVRSDLIARRDYVVEKIKPFSCFSIPEAGYYIFFKLPKIEGNEEKYSQVFENLVENKILLVPGADFGKDFENWFRIAFGNPRTIDDLKIAVDEIVEVIQKIL